MVACGGEHLGDLMGDTSTARIPFGNLQAGGQEELGGASPVAMNVVADQTGTVRKRPGLLSYFPQVVNSQGVSALYETADGNVYAVAGTIPQRNIYWIQSAGPVNLSGHSASDVRGTRRPTMAETEALLVFAGGAEPQKLILTTRDSSQLGGGPPQGTHVVAYADSLFLNTVDPSVATKSQFFFSGPAVGADFSGNEDWSTAHVAGVIRATARPDPVVALYGNTDELFVFGTTTLQVFGKSTDPANPFPPVVTMELGCSAPYSVVQSDRTFAWLDHLRRFVVSDGRTQTVISDPIQRTLHDMSSVSDCFGYRIILGYLDLIVWTFPTDGRSFVFQQGAAWSEWSSWDGSHWTPFPVTAATNLKAKGQVLVGTSAGQMARLDLGTTQDLGRDINAYVITGFQDHKTDAPKSCARVRFALRRGQVETDTEPILLLSWRDDLGPWEPSIPLSLGAPGESSPVVQLHGLGVYRRRQWRLEFTDAADLALVSATEEFEVLGG